MISNEVRQKLVDLKERGLKVHSCKLSLDEFNLRLTFVVEKNFIDTEVLTSHYNREPFKIEADLYNLIDEIFGRFLIVIEREYPLRGFCLQFSKNKE